MEPIGLLSCLHSPLMNSCHEPCEFSAYPPIRFFYITFNIIILSRPRSSVRALPSSVLNNRFYSNVSVPCVLASQPILPCLILLSWQYLVKSKNYEAPQYAVFSVPLLFLLGVAELYFFPQLERRSFGEQRVKLCITFSDTRREEKRLIALTFRAWT